MAAVFSAEPVMEVDAEVEVDEDGEGESIADRAAAATDVAFGAIASSASLCASMLRPNAIEKTFPPSIGESETKPQFSEKCAGNKCQYDAD